jgi:superfamily II DNA or RNA helicase
VIYAATGSGKSALETEIATLTASICAPDEVVVISAPRVSLVEQLSGLESDEVREEWGGGFRPGSVAWRAPVGWVGVFYGARKFISGKRIIVTCNPSLPALVVELAASGKKVRLFLVDECHRSESEEFLAATMTLAPRSRLGFSATPWRAEKGGTVSLFDSIAFSYTFDDALRDGVLVPWRILGWDGADEDDSVDSATLGMIQRIARGPGIVSASSIADAEEYALALAAAGVPALAVHSKLRPREVRSRVARLVDGDPDGPPRCLVHVSLLQEGVDVPALRWLGMRRPVGSTIRFVQEIGRVLRTAPGKTNAKILDPRDIYGRLGLKHNPKIGPAEALEQAMVREMTDGMGPPRFVVDQEAPRAVLISQLAQWARSSLLFLVERGAASLPATNGFFREALPSHSQLNRLQTMAKDAGFPEIGVVVEAPGLTRGDVSDVMSLLFAILTARRRGVDPGIDVPTEAIRAMVGT